MTQMTLATLALLAASAVSASAEMRLTSPDMTEGGTLAPAQVFNGFGCAGGNLSPALEWTGAPEGTKSFVLTAYDPDAPTGSLAQFRKDSTLRNGDIVVTNDGFRVYRNGKFAAIAQDGGKLAQLEKASMSARMKPDRLQAVADRRK